MATHGSSISMTTRGLIASLGTLPVSNYLTLSEITRYKGLDWLIDVTDDTEQGSFSLIIAKQISDMAQGEVDSYLMGQYSVPVVTSPSSAPRMLRLLALRLTIFWLANRRDKVDAIIAKGYEEAIQQLSDIRDGKMQLPGISAGSSFLPDSNHRRDATRKLFNLTRVDTSDDAETIDDGHGGTLDVI